MYFNSNTKYNVSIVFGIQNKCMYLKYVFKVVKFVKVLVVI